ncbi:MAG: hypothetical protein H6772_04985 [Pseudomonadales bacterium]|nr:hypothetical protein [Pseudomonadales bacterium]
MNLNKKATIVSIIIFLFVSIAVSATLKPFNSTESNAIDDKESEIVLKPEETIQLYEEDTLFIEDEVNEDEIDVLIESEPIYIIDNFSDVYYGKVQAEAEEKVFRKGWVAIYDKKSDQELIKIYSNELAFDLHDNKVKANISYLPYGEQSLIHYQDYNFDGTKDLAIMDGQYGCYHGPSFKIYLANDRAFSHNEDFSKLTHGNCGMLDVDPDEEVIVTMTKSGCCWHQVSEYIVEQNIPKKVYIKTRDEMTTTIETLVDGKWEKEVLEQ